MGYIDLRIVQAAGERLSEQISILLNLLEELKQTEQKIKDMAYMDETLYLLQKSQQEIEEEIQSLQAFVQCLDAVGNTWKRTEQKIADVYNLESVVYPRTEFRVSHITGLEKYENLISCLKGGCYE